MKKLFLVLVLVLTSLRGFSEAYTSFYESTKDKTTEELKIELEEGETKVSELNSQIKKLEKTIKKAESKARESGFSDVDVKLVLNRNDLDSKKYELFILTNELQHKREVVKLRVSLEDSLKRLEVSKIRLTDYKNKLEKLTKYLEENTDKISKIELETKKPIKESYEQQIKIYEQQIKGYEQQIKNYEQMAEFTEKLLKREER